MGNRIITTALINLIKEQKISTLPIKEVILVAPDIDTDFFKRDIAPTLIARKNFISLYVSSNDNALIASKIFNGNRRVGDASGQIFIMPGIETIDASKVNTGVLGHSYFNESRTFIEDIFNLI